MDAKARIAEESKREFERKRRSTRRNVNTNREDAVVNQQQSPSQPSPLENNNNSLDLKPAALPSGSKARGGALLFKSDENALEEEDVSQLEEFTCAICLDKPDTLVDLATISGCSHKFCFDCIDKVSLLFQSSLSFLIGDALSRLKHDSIYFPLNGFIICTVGRD